MYFFFFLKKSIYQKIRYTEVKKKKNEKRINPLNQVLFYFILLRKH